MLDLVKVLLAEKCADIVSDFGSVQIANLNRVSADPVDYYREIEVAATFNLGTPEERHFFGRFPIAKPRAEIIAEMQQIFAGDITECSRDFRTHSFGAID